MNSDLSGYSVSELLQFFGDTLRELRTRGVIRSSNNPVADYTEHLAAKGLGLELVTKSTTGYDAIDASGRRYEIKGRRLTPENRSTQLSAIRGLDNDHFEFLIGILFDEDFAVRRACLTPISAVRAAATYRAHVNAWILHLRDSLWEIEGVRDITEEIQTAAGA